MDRSREEPRLPSAGRAWAARWAVVMGLAIGLQGSLGVTPGHGQSATPAWSFAGERPGGQLGFSVSSAGDVNGDGWSDVIVGAPEADDGQVREGMVLLFLGSPNGLSPAPAWVRGGDRSLARFGFAVASAGDVNGDGFGDVLVGAPGDGPAGVDAGAASLYLGSPTGLADEPARVWLGDQAGSRFGAAVACAGDVDSDGFDDVLVGAPGQDDGESDEGAAFLFLGASTTPPAGAAWSAEGGQVGASFGASVASLGDMNGDGFDDVAIGAPHFDHGHVDEGQVRIFAGIPTGLDANPLATFEINEEGALFGHCVAGGGDLTGTGTRRILFGAPIYHYTHMGEGGTFLGALGLSVFFLDFGRQDFARRGISIASAGDVNGDGLQDVVIGADRYDQGEEDEGLVTVHLGHPSFVVDRTPAWFADVDQPFCALGMSVASAGDVNADGYDDVVAGAPLYDEATGDEGRAFLYLGHPGNVAAVEDGAQARGKPTLRLAGPHPFRSALRLDLELPGPGRVQLSVLDVGGRRRAILLDEDREAGRHSVTWTGRDARGEECPPGVYVLRLAFADHVVQRKVVRVP